MKFEKVGNFIVDSAKKMKFGAKKHSPEIFVGVAIVSGIGAVVLTWIAARKTDEVLEKPKEIIETAKAMEITETYTEEDRKHDITIGYLKGGLEIAKLYGPAVLCGAFSIASILASHKILSNRNAGLVAANGILTKEFDDYRKKVIEKYGKEEDYRLRFEDKMEEAEQTITDDDGNEKTVIGKKPVKDYRLSTFSVCFDETNPCWKKDAMYNAMFLNRAMSELTDRLRANRILFLNDVYEYLRVDKTQAGYQYGWVCKPGQENDIYVDFGIGDIGDKAVRSFVFGENNSVWLDFNCSKIVWADTPFKEA